MKETAYVLNLLFCGLWALLLAAGLVCRTFLPTAVLPAMDIPLLVAVNLGALLLEFWLAPGSRRDWTAMTVLAAVTVGLLPLCAGMVSGAEVLKLAAAGGVVFLLAGVVFDSILERLTSGASAKAAPILAAFLLFLASQCFTNIFF